MKKYVMPIISIGLAINGCLPQEKSRTESPPNVIFILADDLGWAQSGAYGSNYYHTPAIDRMASEGIRFTDAYAAAPVCSPTRASVMTGKHPARLHMTNFIPGNPGRDTHRLIQPEIQQFLPLEEFTLGNLFSEHSYETAMFGKWHLCPERFGPGSLPYMPDKQGFNQCLVIDKPCLQSNPELDPHWSDMIGDHSVAFIRENVLKPFFLFMSFSAIHDPLIERADSIAKWREHHESIKPENNPIIAAILERLDWNVGRILDILDELSLVGNTIVVFYSDNGGLTSNAAYYLDYYPEGNALRLAYQTPLREGKGWLYEGGIRVPLIVRWPGVISEGVISNEVVSSYDFMPTFCDLLETAPPPDMDGVSLLSHLKSGESLPTRNHYWHFPHYHRGNPCAAIRSGQWKLIEWYEKSILDDDESAYELYDLVSDISESENLADREPAVTKRLASELSSWRQIIKAQMPVPNVVIKNAKGN